MPESGEQQSSGALKTATAVAGLLAGIVAAVYVLGGLVIALRLHLDHVSLQGAVSAVGQVPRDTVMAAALLNVFALAAVVGLVAAMVYGLADRPRARGSHTNLTRDEWLARSSGSSRIAKAVRWLTWWPMKLVPVLRPRGHRIEPPLDEKGGLARDRLTDGGPWYVTKLFVGLVFVAASGPLLALFVTGEADDQSRLLWAALLAFPLTYAVAAVCVYAIRRSARRTSWGRDGRALAAGVAWFAIALVPVTLAAGAKPFENARLCTTLEPAPVSGRLISESGDRVLLEYPFGDEASILAYPADEVTKVESGDVLSSFTCPSPPDAEAVAKAAEATLDGHGGELERDLAVALRPRLRFDTDEPWRPLEITAFADEQGIALDDLRRGPEAPPFIDIAGRLEEPRSYRSTRRRCRRVAPPALDCNDGQGTAIYYRRTSHEGRWYWDYWWFFRFNRYAGPASDCDFYCSDHEGDWEGVTVITTASLQPEIVGVVYAAHKERILVDAPIVPRLGSHPVVFVANGTHASYPFRCGDEKSCQQFGRLVHVRLPEESHDGEAAWGGNVDAECAEIDCVRPLPEVGDPPDDALPLAGDWAGWTGKWGSTCVNGCRRGESSPNSPGVQTRFQCPWAPTHLGILATDGTVSRAERAGDAGRLRALCEAQRAGL